MKSNSPNMNITNQINAGLNDVRSTIMELAAEGKPFEGNSVNYQFLRDKADFQIDMIFEMISDHFAGDSMAWSDRKYRVAEEFSE